MTEGQMFDEEQFAKQIMVAEAFCNAISNNEQYDYMYGCFILDNLSTVLSTHSNFVILFFDYEEVKELLFKLAEKLNISDDYLIKLKSIHKE